MILLCWIIYFYFWIDFNNLWILAKLLLFVMYVTMHRIDLSSFTWYNLGCNYYIYRSYYLATSQLLCLRRQSTHLENFHKRGGIGPGFCPLCKKDNESIDHILVHCEFAHSVCTEVRKQLRILGSQQSNSMIASYSAWKNVVPLHKTLPYFVSWHIWTHRNKVLF